MLLQLVAEDSYAFSMNLDLVGSINAALGVDVDAQPTASDNKTGFPDFPGETPNGASETKKADKPATADSVKKAINAAIANLRRDFSKTPGSQGGGAEGSGGGRGNRKGKGFNTRLPDGQRCKRGT